MMRIRAQYDLSEDNNSVLYGLIRRKNDIVLNLDETDDEADALYVDAQGQHHPRFPRRSNSNSRAAVPRRLDRSRSRRDSANSVNDVAIEEQNVEHGYGAYPIGLETSKPPRIVINNSHTIPICIDGITHQIGIDVRAVVKRKAPLLNGNVIEQPMKVRTSVKQRPEP